MQLSDCHTIPTPALLPTCTVALYRALPSPEPVTESLTAPVLGAFMGETLDPANASYEKNLLTEPCPSATVTRIRIVVPIPLIVLTFAVLSDVHFVNIAFDDIIFACIEKSLIHKLFE
jgi:hypothetical protein